MLIATKSWPMVVNLLSPRAIELWGGVNTPCLSGHPEQGEYAFVGLGSVARASGGRALAIDLGTRDYRNSRRVTVSTNASHHKGINQSRVFPGENSAAVFLHEPYLIVNSCDTPKVNRSM